jgi:hypothetical protein
LTSFPALGGGACGTDPAGVRPVSHALGNDTRSAAGQPALVRIDGKISELLSCVPTTLDGSPLELLDLTVQPATDILYGLAYTPSSSIVPETSLFTIDETTGTATLVGLTGGPPTKWPFSGFALVSDVGVALALAPNGTLYVASEVWGGSRARSP